MTPTQLGQQAYAAYGRSTQGLTYDGRPMPAWDALGATVQAAWIAAGRAVATTAPDTTQPTQTVHPWRATVRTVSAGALGLLVILPSVLPELGVEALPWAAGLLAVAGGVTRVLAIPAVDVWVTEHLPWLGAARRQP